jgi:hypothetical protein
MKNNSESFIKPSEYSIYRIPYPGQLTGDFDNFHEKFDNFFVKYLVGNFVPDTPILGENDTVITLGSCFAENVGRSLHGMGIKTVTARLHEEANSPQLNAIILQSIFDGELSPNKEHLEKEGFTRELAASFRQKIMAAKCAIFTVGVGLSCTFKNSDLIVLRPREHHRDSLNWRYPSHTEQVGFIEHCLSVFRQLNPSINIIITLSPVPMYKSIDSGSPVVDDCVSKSMLRGAIHEVMQKKWPSVYYWPSFEVFRWIGPHIDPVYGEDDKNHRHVNQVLVDSIMRMFCLYFVQNFVSKKIDASPEVIEVIHD